MKNLTWLVLLLILYSCGGSSTEAGNSCPPIEGHYNTIHYGIYGTGSWGILDVYPDGTFFVSNHASNGSEVITEDAWGSWEMMPDCSVEAWYGDRRVFYKIITNEERTIGSFISVSINPDFPDPREYGQIYK